MENPEGNFQYVLFRLKWKLKAGKDGHEIERESNFIAK